MRAPEFTERALFGKKLEWGRKKRAGRRAVGGESCEQCHVCEEWECLWHGSCSCVCALGTGGAGELLDAAVRTNDQWHARKDQIV